MIVLASERERERDFFLLSLKLGNSKGDEISEDTIKVVADTLQTNFALKVILRNIFYSLLFSVLLTQGKELAGIHN